MFWKAKMHNSEYPVGLPSGPKSGTRYPCFNFAITHEDNTDSPNTSLIRIIYMHSGFRWLPKCVDKLFPSVQVTSTFSSRPNYCLHGRLIVHMSGCGWQLRIQWKPLCVQMIHSF